MYCLFFSDIDCLYIEPPFLFRASTDKILNKKKQQQNRIKKLEINAGAISKYEWMYAHASVAISEYLFKNCTVFECFG